MKKLKHVCYTEYLGNRHLQLIAEGWKEHHCLYADGMQLIKLVKYA
jgi:hypothetical protein